MQSSPEQSAIIHSSFESVMVVEAYAGTGKSTTLEGFCAYRPGSTFLYFVFNKSMKIEATEKFYHLSSVVVETFHSLAYKAIGYKFRHRLEEDLRPADLFRFVKDIADEENLFLFANALLTLLNEFAVSAYPMDIFIKEKRKEKREWSIKTRVSLLSILKILPDVWEVILEDDAIPFSHDFYLKLYQLSNPILRFDYFLVDEAQDISDCMRDIVLQQLNHIPRSKLVFVGDSFQNIYSWRGSNNSLEYIKANYDPEVYYLSRSFRCPQKVALLADRVIKKAGAVKEFIGTDHPNNKTYDTKITYIARRNASIFDFAAQNTDKKIFFVGGIKSYNLNDVLDIKYLQIKRKEFIKNRFIANFSTFKELVQFASKTNDMSLKSLTGIIFKYAEDDLFEIVRQIKASATTNEREADFRLVSAHKSKGLEWPIVELMDDFPLGKKKKLAKLTSSQHREEINLLYVAITRAQRSVSIPENLSSYIESNISLMEECC